jgi:hypothetical protein
MSTQEDSVARALQEGWIPLGEKKLRLGSTIRDAAETLGLDVEKPAHQWREVGGADGLRWTLDCGFLWSPPRTTKVELVFRGDALNQVFGGDASWEPSGTSWDTYNQDIDIRNYWRSRKAFEARLGTPVYSNERSPSLLVAAWHLGGMELTLCWETRTPSLSICIQRPQPKPSI